MVGSKQPVPVFLSVGEAEKHSQAGASVWKFASTDQGLNLDVVLVRIGCELMFEVCAASILCRLCPALRVRIVNVTNLMILESESLHPHSLTHHEFDSLFMPDRPINFNYLYETGKGKYINFLRDNRYMGLYYADYQLDPEGTFDIPKFEGTVFEKGSTDKGESGLKKDGFFVN
jgi:xylulose-5-phosphate/fructose-6-phosphate phosphoketolase